MVVDVDIAHVGSVVGGVGVGVVVGVDCVDVGSDDGIRGVGDVRGDVGVDGIRDVWGVGGVAVVVCCGVYVSVVGVCDVSGGVFVS